MEQLSTCLQKYGVRAVPPLIEELLRCCVVRESAERLTFGQIAKKTSRGAAAAAAGGGVGGSTI
jgi:hypothetical protein